MSIGSKCSHRGVAPHRHQATGSPSSETLDLLKALESDARFRRDSWLGGIFHWGKVSFREVSATDSLHILIDGSDVSAHVDEVSPLATRPDGTIRYAWGRVLAHNLTVIAGDVARRARGVHGEHRCRLHCEAVWVDEEGDVQAPAAADYDASRWPAGTAGTAGGTASRLSPTPPREAMTVTPPHSSGVQPTP